MLYSWNLFSQYSYGCRYCYLQRPGTVTHECIRKMPLHWPYQKLLFGFTRVSQQASLDGNSKALSLTK
jgi:hypothetical protein